MSEAGVGLAEEKRIPTEQAIEQLVIANRILSNEGIFDFLGHASVRNPENPRTFFISRAISPETVTRSDILEVDLDGEVVTRTAMKPYMERIIHAAIYKARPDVGAMVHAHPMPLVTLSIANVPYRPATHPAAIFHEGVPVYNEYDFSSPGNTGMLVTTKEEGGRIASCLGKRRAMLMRGHGCNVVGISIPAMVNATIILRDSAMIQLAAMQVGQPIYLTDEEARSSAPALESGVERAWNYYLARARRTFSDIGIP
jgi:3-hydroxy-2-methylpyridine-4,5-dicarboxylate 4-decarboxylase